MSFLLLLKTFLMVLAVPAVTAVLCVIRKRRDGRSINKYARSVLAGVVFGLVAVCGTEFGIDTGTAILNTRDAAVITAGMTFGWPAALVSAFIGGFERFLAPLWGTGLYTRYACSIATFLAGPITILVMKVMLHDRRPGCLMGFLIGAFTEVFHLLMVILTHMHDLQNALKVVEDCSLWMITINGLSVMLAIIVSDLLLEQPLMDKSGTISIRFGNGIGIIMTGACLLSSLFIHILCKALLSAKTEGGFFLSSLISITSIMILILVFAVIFIAVFFLVRRQVIDNVESVNESLKSITSGNLDVVLDVKGNREFAELSDGINTTVDSLKTLIAKEKKRIDEELEFAKQIQENSLPKVFPEDEDFELYASMNPARDVGGDFFDFFRVGNSKIFFAVADVSGKGIPAALFMMKAKTLMRNLAESGREVDEIFTRANAELCENNDARMFVTSWMGCLDLTSGVLSYADAGHNPPVIVRKGSAPEYLMCKPDLFLGAFDGIKYRRNELQLNPGDFVYLYTDGVTEANDENGGLYGEKRLLDALSLKKDESVRTICEGVLNDVDSFTGKAAQYDDITMLCLRYNPCPVEICIRPDIGSLSGVQDFIGQNIKGSEDFVSKFRICADEILSNIINHSESCTEITLGIVSAGNASILSVKDNGSAFNPLLNDDPDTALGVDDRPIGGLGIFLVKKLMDEVSYSYEDRHNILTLKKSQKTL